jgi:hypothetical protein
VTVDGLDGPVELTIRPGSRGGQRLRLRVRGLRRRDGGRGDLYVRLKVVVPTRPSPEERELFQRLAAVSSFRPRQAGHGGRPMPGHELMLHPVVSERLTLQSLAAAAEVHPDLVPQPTQRQPSVQYIPTPYGPPTTRKDER